MNNYYSRYADAEYFDDFSLPHSRRRISRRRPVYQALGPDILRGAREIALFLYEDANQTRRVYYLIQEGQLPVFRLGGRLHARRSVLIDFVERQEDAAISNLGEVRP